MNNGNNNERNGRKSNGDPGKNTRQTKPDEDGSVLGQNNDERGLQSLPSKEQGAILLPELTEQDFEAALHQDGVSWAKATRELGLGLVWNEPIMGMAFQAISDDSLRLLTVVDHPYCLRMAAMVASTLDHVGMRLVVDEHSILAEYSDNVVPVTGDPRSGTDPSNDVGVV